MKINREKLAKEIKYEIDLIDTLKKKIIKHKNSERILESGLTNNSKLKIELLNVFNSENRVDFNMLYKLGSSTQEQDLNSLSRKIKLYIRFLIQQY